MFAVTQPRSFVAPICQIAADICERSLLVNWHSYADNNTDDDLYYVLDVSPHLSKVILQN